MITENSVTYQFIGNVDHTPVLDSHVENLAEGMVAIVDDAGLILDDAAIPGGTRVKVAQRVNGQLVFSPVFNWDGAVRVTPQAFVAPVEQVSYVGYNSVTGAGQLDTEDGREYLMSLWLYHTQGVFNNTPMVKSIPAWVPPTPGATAGEIQFALATALVTSLNRQFRRAPSQVVIGEIVTDNAGVAAVNGAGDADEVAVINGSNFAAFNDLGIGAGHNFDVGNIVLLDGVAYTITGVTLGAGGGITLNLPYAGATGTILWVDVTIIAAIGAGDNFGIRLTGATSAYRNPVTEVPAQVEFKVTFDKVMNAADNGIQPVILTALTTQVNPTNGIGTGAQVAYKEVYATMNEGNAQICAYPPTNYRRAAILNAQYDMFVINYTDIVDTFTVATTGQRPVSKFNIIIAVSDTDARDILDNQLI